MIVLATRTDGAQLVVDQRGDTTGFILKHGVKGPRRKIGTILTMSPYWSGVPAEKEVDALLLTKARAPGFESTMRRTAVDFVRDVAVRQASGIAERTKSRLANVIAKGLDERRSTSEIATDLEDTLKRLSPARAATIARTEVHRAANYAAVEALKEDDDPTSILLTWCCVWDERTRTTHEDADGQTQAMGDGFEVGGDVLRFPGDPEGSPEETINCRCSLLPSRA